MSAMEESTSGTDGSVAQSVNSSRSALEAFLLRDLRALRVSTALLVECRFVLRVQEGGVLQIFFLPNRRKQR